MVRLRFCRVEVTLGQCIHLVLEAWEDPPEFRDLGGRWDRHMVREVRVSALAYLAYIEPSSLSVREGGYVDLPHLAWVDDAGERRRL